MTRSASASAVPPREPCSLGARLFETRRLSQELTRGLSAEDMAVQAMDDASPVKWHLAHTAWFFETFVLAVHLDGYQPFDEAFNYCFNSYYESQGLRQPRPKRGLLTRPSIERVFAYRAHVDEGLEKLLSGGFAPGPEAARVIEIGINHEQQHQELLLTDILALFAANPLRPAYRSPRPRADHGDPEGIRWITYAGGIYEIGHSGEGFAWDNETPCHRQLIHPFRLAGRLATNAEWLTFIDDGGYRTFALWLADGWAAINREGWRAPLYWEERDGQWFTMTLDGMRPVVRSAPVAHVSYYEADAFARWAGHRLPTEFEWEVAARSVEEPGNTLSSGALRPLPVVSRQDGQPRQMFGDVWEWTQSAYLPYPGYRAPLGALGEYNGKFMVGQQVLRGGSCVTPEGHTRATYRNFFYPHQRWQFTGLRLASEVS
ncbi:MAG: ergothioneine biosynthesis protein EgtB [Beijerinckiaceae bacterium]|nr:ergothioneine biosynthesis protein EgtB [Beijerinckiaceae bacterium]MCI0736625.1 ergothioneine biosynthesis protein EgtB [Beijerinckiaceae bacterium]